MVQPFQVNFESVSNKSFNFFSKLKTWKVEPNTPKYSKANFSLTHYYFMDLSFN